MQAAGQVAAGLDHHGLFKSGFRSEMYDCSAGANLDDVDSNGRELGDWGR